MKKVKLIGIIALLAIIVLGVVGYSLLSGTKTYSLEIRNQSSVTVAVNADISGKDRWRGNLSPGTSHTISAQFPGSETVRYTVTYTVDGKTGTKSITWGQYADPKKTVNITQADVNGL